MSNETQAVQKAEPQTMQTDIDAVENALIEGDLSDLSSQERKRYYREVCKSVGLNPLTRPFAYIRLNGQLTLYAKRDAAEQLRKINGVSVTDMQSGKQGDLYVCRVTVQDGEGRTDMATGAVNIAGLSGDRLANAIMKAETKSKRRATLSICGLGWLDETELETIPSAQEANVDHETGEIEEIPAETVDEPEEQPDLTEGPVPATEKQLNYIGLLRSQKGIDKDFLKDLAENVCGKRDAQELTKDEASELIEELQDLPDQDEQD